MTGNTTDKAKTYAELTEAEKQERATIYRENINAARYNSFDAFIERKIKEGS